MLKYFNKPISILLLAMQAVYLFMQKPENRRFE